MTIKGIDEIVVIWLIATPVTFGKVVKLPEMVAPNKGVELYGVSEYLYVLLGINPEISEPVLPLPLLIPLLLPLYIDYFHHLPKFYFCIYN